MLTAPRDLRATLEEYSSAGFAALHGMSLRLLLLAADGREFVARVATHLSSIGDLGAAFCQKTREGCGCFWGLCGSSGGNFGCFKERCSFLLRKRQFVHKNFVHNFCAPSPPLPKQESDGFPLEFLLKGSQKELRTLSPNCEQTLQNCEQTEL